MQSLTNDFFPHSTKTEKKSSNLFSDTKDPQIAKKNLEKPNYGKPRQSIKKQTHHFTDKSPYSQSHSFSSSYAWM